MGSVPAAAVSPAGSAEAAVAREARRLADMTVSTPQWVAAPRVVQVRVVE